MDATNKWVVHNVKQVNTILWRFSVITNFANRVGYGVGVWNFVAGGRIEATGSGRSVWFIL
jgi:hypothetical protein